VIDNERTSRLGRAITWCVRVDSSLCSGRQQLRCDRPCRHARRVYKHMDVRGPAMIDEAFSGVVNMGLALRIIAFIGGDLTQSHRDQAGTEVCV
jgi:hypothetical protein